MEGTGDPAAVSWKNRPSPVIDDDTALGWCAVLLAISVVGAIVMAAQEAGSEGYFDIGCAPLGDRGLAAVVVPRTCPRRSGAR
jgi:hypothetical protein